MKNKPIKTKTPPEESVLTKDEFLKVLHKVTKPVKPKPARGKGKSKTSG